MRVLAIDQAPKEKEGQSVVVGKTATLELKPEQAETLAPRAPERHAVAGAAQHRRRQRGREAPTNKLSRRGESLNVVRYGVASQQTMQK